MTEYGHMGGSNYPRLLRQIFHVAARQGASRILLEDRP